MARSIWQLFDIGKSAIGYNDVESLQEIYKDLKLQVHSPRKYSIEELLCAYKQHTMQHWSAHWSRDIYSERCSRKGQKKLYCDKVKNLHSACICNLSYLYASNLHAYASRRRSKQVKTSRYL